MSNSIVEGIASFVNPNKNNETMYQSIQETFGVKKSEKEKCSTCINGYNEKFTIYYGKNKNNDECILQIQKKNSEYIVTNLNLTGVYGKEAQQSLSSIDELNKIYPVLKVIPIKTKYYSISEGKELIPGKDFILKEIPDYEGVGLIQPRIAGGRKSRKSRKSRKYKKSRKYN